MKHLRAMIEPGTRFFAQYPAVLSGYIIYSYLFVSILRLFIKVKYYGTALSDAYDIFSALPFMWLLSVSLVKIIDYRSKLHNSETRRMRSEMELQTNADAIVTADGSGIIIGWNSGAERIFGYSYTESVGQPLTSIMPLYNHAGQTNGIKRLQSGGDQHVIGKTVELEGLRKDNSVFPVELSLSSWETKSEQFFTGIIRDISERKRAEQERESLVNELKTSLENVKTLGGLVPICAHCKKIRDDKGYWNQLEKYILDHTDAKLTHGICPDCAKLYFPGFTGETSLGGQ